MASNYEPGNKMPLGGSPSPTSSESREDGIISKTKALAFPSGAILSLENFESAGGGAGMNSVAKMEKLTGKELQESYRVGAVNARDMSSYTEKVSDR